MNYRLLNRSVQYSKNPHPILYHLLGKLFGISNLGFYFLGYAYGKWIDDQIDSATQNYDAGRDLLIRQRKIIDGNLTATCIPEEFGAHLGKHFKTLKGKMSGHWFLYLFDTFEIDINRKFKILSKKELENRMNLLGTAYIKFCQSILAPKEILSDNLLASTIKAYIQIDMLLDLEEDLKVGFCNVPAEFLESIKLNFQEVYSEKFAELKPLLKPYVALNSIKIRDAMKASIPEVQQINSLPLKFFFNKMYKKRILKLNDLDLKWSTI